jgi:cytosine/adenosine deaminase-related metal-dependent hydrolase
MFKFSADRIFTGTGMAEPDTVLVTDENGRVLDLVSKQEAGDDIRYFEGILTPGFVNAHCHLELSHLKNQVQAGTGLPAFLQQIVEKRNFSRENILSAIRDAEQEMWDEGIVAVGDICNTTDTIDIKRESSIQWTNFIEVLSFSDAKAQERIAHYCDIRDKFRTRKDLSSEASQPFRSNITPHAPYSISPLSFLLINEATAGQVISLHNQETPAEDELYRSGTGSFLPFFERFGHRSSPFPVTGVSSIRSVLPHFNKSQEIILVHNTCTSPEDLRFADDHALKNNLKLHYCICINANLYIESRTPPVIELMKDGRSIVLGTDSLSSNYRLSITEEIRTILTHFPDLSLETILQWATLNGARALRYDHALGSFGKGKKPGIVLLDDNLNAKRLL